MSTRDGRADSAGLFAGTIKPEPAGGGEVPDRTAGIPPRPEPARRVTELPEAPRLEPDRAPRSPERGATTRPAVDTGGLVRYSVQLDADTHSRLRDVTQRNGMWLHDFLETAVDRHESQLRHKGAVTRYRRQRRDSPRLIPQAIRVTERTDKQIRALADRHKVSLADATRAVIKAALDDPADPPV